MGPAEDARHLRTLEQLREGKAPHAVWIERPRADGRVDVWFAAGGRFEKRPDGGWEYVDELGRRWARRQHDRFAATHGRLPYGHAVMTAQEASRRRDGSARLHFWRPALRQPAVDDRNGLGLRPDGAVDSSRSSQLRRDRERRRRRER